MKETFKMILVIEDLSANLKTLSRQFSDKDEDTYLIVKEMFSHELKSQILNLSVQCQNQTPVSKERFNSMDENRDVNQSFLSNHCKKIKLV